MRREAAGLSKYSEQVLFTSQNHHTTGFLEPFLERYLTR